MRAGKPDSAAPMAGLSLHLREIAGVTAPRLREVQKTGGRPPQYDWAAEVMIVSVPRRAIAIELRRKAVRVAANGGVNEC